MEADGLNTENKPTLLYRNRFMEPGQQIVPTPLFVAGRAKPSTDPWFRGVSGQVAPPFCGDAQGCPFPNMCGIVTACVLWMTIAPSTPCMTPI